MGEMRGPGERVKIAPINKRGKGIVSEYKQPSSIFYKVSEYQCHVLNVSKAILCPRFLVVRLINARYRGDRLRCGTRWTVCNRSMSKREAIYIQGCELYNIGMSGATFKTQNQAPRDTPTPLNEFPVPTSLGVPKENLTENHPTVAESFTSSVTPAEVLPADSSIVQPGEYHPGYAAQMVRYFDKPKVKKTYETFTWRSGAVTEKERYIPATPPHFSEFARSIGVTTRTLKRWAAQHEEFREAYITCEEIYEEFLIENGLTGAYGAIAMKFVAVNKTKMKDKVVTENVHVDINKVLDGIAAGKVKPGGQLEIAGDDF